MACITPLAPEHLPRALGGNKPKTAEQLGISLKTLYNRLNVYQGHGHHERPLPPGD
jgi:DNA-binding NtrC family response regulator